MVKQLRYGVAVLLAVGSLSAARVAVATDTCTNLPLSQFQVYQITAQDLNVQNVTADQLGQYRADHELVSRHTMMLSGAEFGIWHAIEHRTFPLGDHLFCDAPVLVRVIMGSRRRFALLDHDVARDECLRQSMVEHEAAHTRAFEKAISRFIVAQTSFLQQGLAALKQTPGSSPEAVIQQWDNGLKLLVGEAMGQLMMDLLVANRETDSPDALAALENACGGKLHGLEQPRRDP